MPHVAATWTSPTGSQSVATGSGGHTVVIDAPNGCSGWAGFKPSELLLAALLGCAGVDFTSILAKQRQHVTSISAEVQDQDPPWAYRTIDIVFTIRGKRLDRPRGGSCVGPRARALLFGGRDLAGTGTISHRAVIEQEEPVAALV